MGVSAVIGAGSGRGLLITEDCGVLRGGLPSPGTGPRWSRKIGAFLTDDYVVAEDFDPDRGRFVRSSRKIDVSRSIFVVIR
jgi:hypothetical protein